MTTHDRADKRGGMAGRGPQTHLLALGGPGKPYRIVGTAVLVVALGLVILWITVVRGGQGPVNTVETFVAQRGPLTFSVLEAGTLMAKDPVIVRSSMRRSATIIYLVPEGVRVNQGDLLVELDTSELIDHIPDHKIMVTNAEAAWINAREAAIITKSLAQSRVELAQLDYDFAKLDLRKYQGEGGQYATDLVKAEGNIAMAEQEVKKNDDYYTWSQRLAQQKYLSATQLQTDELTLRKSQLNLTVAKSSLELMEKYTRQRQLVQLQSDVNQAEAALDRAKAKAHANLVQAEALLAAREQEYRHQQEMLAKHEEEVRQSKLYAPTEGMVIYATSGRGGGFHNDRPPLAEGVDVWNRQELIYLQRSASTVAEVDLHEANLEKVRVGLPAVVTVDALPGRKLLGTVSHIAPLADSQSMWMNPDLKVYKTEIALEANDPALRSGMNCKAEILIDRRADAVCVPVQAVTRVGGQPTVYVLRPDGRTEERRVEIGLNDNTLVEIVSGLNENELVRLTPTLKTAAAESGPRLAASRGAESNAMAQQIREKLKAAGGPVVVVPRPGSRGPEPERTTQ
ncbi:MAG: efflux transporter periplasmic adaptor subunit [Phycisphaerae bacterium]|nr:efflux transporter periplasmic adaptor subunit [Phycisphaerae bacterium]